jgi:hypothetical protein
MTILWITVLVAFFLVGAPAFSTYKTYQGDDIIHHFKKAHAHYNNNGNIRQYSSTAASITVSTGHNNKHNTYLPISFISPLAVARYGPQLPPPTNQTQETDDNDNDDDDIQQQEDRRIFRRLVEQILHASSQDKPEHIPRILANHMEFVLSLLLPQQGAQMSKIIDHLLEETEKQQLQEEQDNKQFINNNSQDSHYQQTLQVVDVILTFAEEFVQQAQEMDQHNKKLLGKIIKVMKRADQEESYPMSAISSSGIMMSREESLDQVLEQERVHFTPGFLRHLEGECERISSAPTMTRESARLLELLRMIQTRVLEELGKDMGEAALVLGQLMGYNDDNDKNNEELLGVLEAGLTVRGTDFATEMWKLTQEALDGFQRIPGGGVDPELVERVKLIDSRLQEFPVTMIML